MSNQDLNIFHNIPVPLLNLDVSKVKKYVSPFCASGTTDFSLCLDAHPVLITECMNRTHLIDANAAAINLFEIPNKAYLSDNLLHIFTHSLLSISTNLLIALADEKSNFDCDATLQTIHGREFQSHLSYSFINEKADDWSSVVISITDVFASREVERQPFKFNEFNEITCHLAHTFNYDSTEELDKDISSGLEEVGRFFELTDSYIISVEATTSPLHQKYEWHSEASMPSSQLCTDFDPEVFSRVFSTITADKPLVADRVHRLPAEMRAESSPFGMLKLTSMVIVPIRMHHQAPGIFIFGIDDHEKVWTNREIEMLKLTAEIFTAALTRSNSPISFAAATRKYRNRERSISKTGKIAGTLLLSQEMKAVAKHALSLHESPEIPVLIVGETGVGKELIAKLIHNGNRRARRPFIDINVASLPDNLFEAELFGYEPGAFTGALRGGQRGKLELASRGTLFLDEIGDMPLQLQAKLLRVIQNRSYYRVGGTTKYEFGGRIICATNADLQRAVRDGGFRSDLYFRLKGAFLQLSPLRQRKSEILPLAEHFLTKIAGKRGHAAKTLSAEVSGYILEYDWPGNIRELRNTLEFADLIANEDLILIEHIQTEGSEACCTSAFTDFTRRLFPVEAAIHLPDEVFDLDEVNKVIIHHALERFNNNKTRAAEYLGLSRHALSRRLKKLGTD